MVELPNRSPYPQSSYVLVPGDLRLELQSWLKDRDPEEVSSMAIWHTHPEGNIGPSRGDMRKRLEGVAYLVVALTDQGAIPTWF